MKYTKVIALSGIFLGLILAVLLLEGTIFGFLLANTAILSISIVLIFSLHDNYLTGILGGVLFGLASFLSALILPKFALFLHPMISIVPRLFVGISAYGAYRLLKLILGRFNNLFVKDILPLALAAAVGVTVNTALVIWAISIFAPENGAFAAIFSMLVLTNYVPELIGAMIIAPPAVLAVRKVVGKKS